MSYSGSCLCGAVTYQGEGEMGGGHCHCQDCRKASGAGHFSIMMAPEASFTVTGDVRFYSSPADSGNAVNRGFCPTCGSPVYSTNSGFEGLVFLPVAALDDPEVFQPQMSVYTRSAVSWDQPAEDLPKFETMPSPEQMPV